MSEYEKNEKDIESVINYLKIYDPENADREYAVQLLELMEGLASDLVKGSERGEIDPQIIQALLEQKKNSSAQ